MNSIIAIKTYSGRTEASVTVMHVPGRGQRHAQVAQKIRSHIGGVDRLVRQPNGTGLPTTPYMYVVIIKTAIITIITSITCKS